MTVVELLAKLTVKFDNQGNVQNFPIPILPKSFVIIYKLVKHFLSGGKTECRLQFIEIIKIAPSTRVMLKTVFQVLTENVSFGFTREYCNHFRNNSPEFGLPRSI